MTLERNVAFLEIYVDGVTIWSSALKKQLTGSVQEGILYSSNNYMIVKLYASQLQTSFSSRTLQYTSGKLV